MTPCRHVLTLLILCTVAVSAQNFREQQKRYPRVRQAYEHALPAVRSAFRNAGVRYPPAAVLLRLFKDEARLELWAAGAAGDTLRRVKSWDVCSSSGQCGPKRREGDGQVPEGFYEITTFNPQSDYHLSLRISYPNASDRLLGHRRALGGDIFLHGRCVTIGCVPLGDEGIEELYVVCVDARAAGQRSIPVHVFPWDFRRDDADELARSCAGGAHRAFWQNLREGFDLFEHRHRLPAVRVDAAGNYRFTMPGSGR
jgi:murein L,D-transpeptidase YafK